MKKHTWYNCVWDVKHIRDSKVIWSEQKENALSDEGEDLILRVFFRNEAAPAEFYVRMAYDTLVETDKLIDVVKEPIGAGYAPKLLERSAIGFSDSNFEVPNVVPYLRTKVVTFEASGGAIGPVNTLFLASTSDNTGKLIAFLGLSSNRTIQDGDRLEISFTVQFINSPLITYDGMKLMLRSFFRGDFALTSLYVRLANEVVTAQTQLADIISEPVGNGYYDSPEAISNATLPASSVGFPSVVFEAGDHKIISKEYIFTASGGDIGPVSVALLSTTVDNTGFLVAFMNLPVIKSITDGVSTNDTVSVKLK